MRPIAELADETLRALRGIVFDIDETLSTHGRIFPGAFAALWSLHEARLALLAVTGRPLGWADAMAATWPIDAAVGENGAGWAYRRAGGLSLGYFDDDAVRAERCALLDRVRGAVASAHPDVQLATDQAARRCDLAFDVGERARLDDGEIASLVATIEACGARALVSSVHAHVLVGDWDKPKGAVRAVRDALGEELDPARWLYVGDSGNDAAAFAFFGVTVGVANVREHLSRLPVPPRFVTSAERGAGFAELAERVVAARMDG